MISEIIPEAYDVHGRKTSKPGKRRSRVFHPTFPIGRYFSHPLRQKFKDIDALRSFLKKCRYVTDNEQFDKDDCWMPPEDFEKIRKGDCEDFALYTWRQLTQMGYKSRFVAGYSGRYGSGHAWVTLERKGRFYICEPVASHFSRLPRLNMLRYRPNISVEWDGSKAHYYAHEPRQYNPPFREVFMLVAEWAWFWSVVLIKILLRFAAFPIRHFIKKSDK